MERRFSASSASRISRGLRVEDDGGENDPEDEERAGVIVSAGVGGSATSGGEVGRLGERDVTGATEVCGN